MSELQGHPKIGSSWEGFCLEQLIGALKTRDVYFWATHAGAELDLLVTVAGNRYGFEFKYADAPGSNRSIRIAIEDIGLEHLWKIYPGRKKYDIKYYIMRLIFITFSFVFKYSIEIDIIGMFMKLGLELKPRKRNRYN